MLLDLAFVKAEDILPTPHAVHELTVSHRESRNAVGVTDC